MDLIEWSADHDERRRREHRNLWRQYYFRLAATHYALAEENRKKAFAFGDAEEESDNEKGEAAA